MRDINYVIILDCYTGRIIKIKLTSEEKRMSIIYEDFEDFIKCELERKYGFSLEDSSWMCCKDLDEVEYNF